MTETASGLDITLTHATDTHAILTTDAVLYRGSSGGTTPYDLGGALTLLPLPRRATEILDFTGKWSRERSPQRRPLHHGAHVRDVRRGKPGVDSPYLVPVGVPGFGLRTGEVCAVHVAWSGDQRYLVEQLPKAEACTPPPSGVGRPDIPRLGKWEEAARWRPHVGICGLHVLIAMARQRPPVPRWR
ncbi:glycoside hydrolase family 36 N-terminal domain-containing protein [Streptomyces sp. NBC_01450]|uniref:glycoside hydrolase family 36 N-terminal domain-containing protein n=1 Tax=Streptomyces sp. NBC_01450 TaxID=2903871 RepID=UPI002E379B61|nr:glycoside hydrolase family 36 N-terminal domain-containing protein [Streptomyces sp. NBC_01450]